jgi:DNA-binding CsgD family transcriptional regulator
VGKRWRRYFEIPIDGCELRAHSSLGKPEEAMMSALTRRQIECLAWAQEGKTAYEIGVILGISSRTVEAHFQRSYQVLGVTSRIQAILKTRETGQLRK